jgi:hypothetical protein
VDPFLAEVVDDARVPHVSEENAANTGSKGLTRGSHASVGGSGVCGHGAPAVCARGPPRTGPHGSGSQKMKMEKGKE